MKKSRGRRGDSRQRINEHDGGAGLTNIMGMAQRINEHDGGAGLTSIMEMVMQEMQAMLWLQTGLAWLTLGQGAVQRTLLGQRAV